MFGRGDGRRRAKSGCSGAVQREMAGYCCRSGEQIDEWAGSRVAEAQQAIKGSEGGRAGGRRATTSWWMAIQWRLTDGDGGEQQGRGPGQRTLEGCGLARVSRWGPVAPAIGSLSSSSSTHVSSSSLGT